MSAAAQPRLVVHCPDSFRAEREHAAEVVLSRFLGLPHRLVVGDRPGVEIGLEGEPGRLALADVLFQTPDSEWLTEAALPRLPLDHWRVSEDLPDLTNLDPLPALFSASEMRTGYLHRTDSGLSLGLDVLGSCFFLVTRYEELAIPERDPHGRFPWASSIAHQAGFLERPLANEYAAVLFATMRRLWPRLERPRRKLRLLLTHDVDFPFYARQARRHVMRSAAADVIKRREPGLALRRLSAYARRKAPDLPERDPAFTFDFILRENERHGLRCCVNFMTETSGFGSVSYSLREPWARSLLHRLRDNGHLRRLSPELRLVPRPCTAASSVRAAPGRGGA